MMRQRLGPQTMLASHRSSVSASSASYSRRSASRIESVEGVYVYWSCNGRDDLSRVTDLSIGGMFLEVAKPRAAIGNTTKLYFLVSEGSIRADAVIRYILPGEGVGLKLTALPEEDRARFASLVKRLRG